MKRNVRILLSLLLACVFLLPVTPPRAVAEYDIMPAYYTHVTFCHPVCYISGGSVYVEGSGGSSAADTTAYMYTTLQRRLKTGGNWSPCGHWSTTSTGVCVLSTSGSVEYNSAYEYRTYVNIQVKDSTGYILDSVGEYSEIVP